MRARAAEGKSERESIMDETPDDVRSKSLRDGAMPCCVLTLLLVVASSLGAAAVWLSLAAFDPEHSTSSLVLLSKPVPSVAHNATATATRGSANKTSARGSGGGGGGPESFRFEAANIDDETWQVTAILTVVMLTVAHPEPNVPGQVTAVRDAQGQPLDWASAITELREGRLGPSLNAQLAASPHARHSVSKGARATLRHAGQNRIAPALARLRHSPLTPGSLLWTTGGLLLGDSAHDPRHRRRHPIHLCHGRRPRPGTGRARRRAVRRAAQGVRGGGRGAQLRQPRRRRDPHLAVRHAGGGGCLRPPRHVRAPGPRGAAGCLLEEGGADHKPDAGGERGRADLGEHRQALVRVRVRVKPSSAEPAPPPPHPNPRCPHPPPSPSPPLALTPHQVSTEGSGVSWVHVRLDAEPKYYHHSPYRPFAAPAAARRREQREESAAGAQRRRRGSARAD